MTDEQFEIEVRAALFQKFMDGATERYKESEPGMAEKVGNMYADLASKQIVDALANPGVRNVIHTYMMGN